MSKLDMFNIPESISWLGDRTILLGIVGSNAYGTNTKDSDLDYKGVCVPPEDYYLGLHSFNDYNTTGGKNWKSTKDDIDISIMHINKFILDCMQGVPNNIELLFLRDKDYIDITPLGKELIESRDMFLSKAIRHKFGGYAHSQIMKLKAKQSNGTGRQDLIERFGFDCDFAMHSVRLLTSAIEILETGTFTTYRPNHKHLLDIRNGKYTLEEVLLEVEGLNNRLQHLYETSDKVPHRPDFNRINRWLVEFNKKAIQYFKEEH